MKSKTDTDLMEQQFTTTTTVNPTKGSRVRITLDNGQYFVLRMPENYDGLFHEITSNSKFRLLAKFEGKPDEAGAAPAAPPPAITYESALAKGNAIVLCYSLVHSIVRRNYSVPSSVFLSLPVGSVDFYLCCGAMSVLYLIYLMARSRSSGGGGEGALDRNGNGKWKGREAKLTLQSVLKANANASGSVKIPSPKPQSSPSNGSNGSNGTPSGPSSSSVPAGPLKTPPKMSATVRPSPSPSSPPIPPPSSWIHSPLLIRCAPSVPCRIDGVRCTPTSQLRVNVVPIPFETSLFKGLAMIRIANLPDSPPSYFRGRSRKMQVCVQGSFKSRTRFDSVFGGQEFVRAIPSLPPRSVVETVFSLLASKLPPAFLCDVFSQEPYFLSPLVNTCQGFRVERRGEERPVEGEERDGWNVKEETGLLGAEVPDEPERRRRFFAKRENLERFYYEPDLVYTFDCYQHYMDMASMQFIVTRFLQFDVTRIIGRQPLQLSLAKNMDTEEYYWNFEVWHEKLIAKEKEGREWKGREGNGREGNGREGKGRK